MAATKRGVVASSIILDFPFWSPMSQFLLLFKPPSPLILWQRSKHIEIGADSERLKKGFVEALAREEVSGNYSPSSWVRDPPPMFGNDPGLLISSLSPSHFPYESSLIFISVLSLYLLQCPYVYLIVFWSMHNAPIMMEI